MEGLGDRLRARARELGWSDAEVARRVGLAQTRYANYVTDRHEPDLATFVRICSVLGVSASELLGSIVHGSSKVVGLRSRIAAATEMLDPESLAALAVVVDGLVARMSRIDPTERLPSSTGGTGTA